MALVVGTFVFVAGFVVLEVRSAAWVAEADAVVVPDAANRGEDAYELDLLTRDLLLSTHARILEDRRFWEEAARDLRLDDATRRSVRITASASPTTTVVTVTATGPDRALVDSMAKGTLERGRRFFDSLDRLFVLDPVPSARGAYQVEQTRLARLALVLLACAGCTWAAYWLPTRSTRYR